MADSMSPAQKITFTLYAVSVPRVYMQSAESANFYGTIAHDNPKAQKEQEIGDIRCNLSITRMAELFNRGCRPWFLTPACTSRMYLDLFEYLRSVETAFQENTTSSRFTDELMENLLMLENFAQWLFGVAKPYLPLDEDKPLGTLAGYRKRVPIGRVSHDQQKAVAEQIDTREHVRVVDQIIERKVARGRSGWM
jgi:hypothetical protein